MMLQRTILMESARKRPTKPGYLVIVIDKYGAFRLEPCYLYGNGFLIDSVVLSKFAIDSNSLDLRVRTTELKHIHSGGFASCHSIF